jgi:hypothetical protein
VHTDINEQTGETDEESQCTEGSDAGLSNRQKDSRIVKEEKQTFEKYSGLNAHMGLRDMAGRRILKGCYEWNRF